MITKTPRQLLHETLEACSREVATWSAWMRSAVSMANVFNTTPPPPKVTPEAVLAALAGGGRTMTQLYDALKCTTPHVCRPLISMWHPTTSMSCSHSRCLLADCTTGAGLQGKHEDHCYSLEA